MSTTGFTVLCASVGVILTLAGFFGPDDQGTLEVIGLVLVAIAIWKGWPS